MKNLITTLILLSAINIGNAQYAGSATSGSSTSSGNTSSSSSYAISHFLGAINDADNKRQSNWLKNAKGTPYASNKFAPTILFYNNEKVGNLYYRYNALNEEVEIKKSIIEKGNSALINDKKIHILVNGKKLAFNTFVTSKKRTTNGYLTELVTGKNYDLYRRTTVKFTEGVPAQNSFVAAVPAKFSQFTEYYIQKKGVNRIDEVLSKNSKLLKMLDVSEKAKVKTYIKANKLNAKNEADLIQIFMFLNQKNS